MRSDPTKALIFGVSGQDGAYLAQLLSAEGIEVHGTSRDKDSTTFGNLRALGILDRVKVHTVAPADFRSVVTALNAVRPRYVYNLAAQSSVGLSFEQPVETIDSILHATVNIMEAIRFLGIDARFYNASSSECFGNTDTGPANETTPFKPRSPYAVGKAAAFWAVANYREAYGLFSCSGILFNHESPLRPARYVTQKIVRGAIDIRNKRADILELGALDLARDWGWAPEYVVAMHRMLQFQSPDDFVIATGQSSTIRDFVAEVFAALDLDWTRHVQTNERYMRPTDIAISVGDPGKAERLLGWSAATRMPEVARRLVAAQLASERS